MGESKRRKNREEEIARTPRSARYARGETLIGNFVLEAEDVGPLRDEVRRFFLTPNALRPQAERLAALARFDASPIDAMPSEEVGVYHLWTLDGEARPMDEDAYEASGLVEVDGSMVVHVVVKGEPEILECSLAEGGPATDPSRLAGMIRLRDGDDEPVSSCDLPLTIQAETLGIFSEFVSESFAGHRAHAAALLASVGGAVFRDDDAWIDFGLGVDALDFLGDPDEAEDHEAGSLGDSCARLRWRIESTPLRDLGRRVALPAEHWMRIDDEGAGIVWDHAVRSIRTLDDGTRFPGANAMLLPMEGLLPREIRADFLKDASVIAKGERGELFGFPDGRLASILVNSGSTTLVVWDPKDGPGEPDRRFSSQRLLDVAPSDLPPGKHREEFEDLDLGSFLPSCYGFPEFGALALLKAHAAGATLLDFLAALAQVARKTDRAPPPEDGVEDEEAEWRRRVLAREVEADRLSALAAGGVARPELVSILGYLGDALDDYEDEILERDSAVEWPMLPDLSREARLILDAHRAGATLADLGETWMEREGLVNVYNWSSPRIDAEDWFKAA